MLKHLLIIFIFISTSCESQENNWEKLNNTLQNSLTYCEPCLDEFSEKRIGYLFNTLNKDLETTMFQKLSFKRQISFSFCNNNYNEGKEKGYLDCFYITEYKANSQKEVENIFKYIDKITEITIYYKPPHYWHWLKKEDKIYFIYSNEYNPKTTEFNSVTNIVKEIYDIH